MESQKQRQNDEEDNYVEKKWQIIRKRILNGTKIYRQYYILFASPRCLSFSSFISTWKIYFAIIIAAAAAFSQASFRHSLTYSSYCFFMLVVIHTHTQSQPENGSFCGQFICNGMSDRLMSICVTWKRSQSFHFILFHVTAQHSEWMSGKNFMEWMCESVSWICYGMNESISCFSLYMGKNYWSGSCIW